jgi:hypothetical protein
VGSIWGPGSHASRMLKRVIKPFSILKDVTDHLVNQHRSLEDAHRLVDLSDDLTIGAG